ncbi:MAG TPA: CapA family protein [Ruminococcus sp.]|nr:CapA family protein [Ruminococcus sp.]
MRSIKFRTLAAFTAMAMLMLSGTGCGKTVGKYEEETASSETNSQDEVSDLTTAETTAEPATEPVSEDKVVHVAAAGDNLIHYSVFKAAEANAGPGERYDFGPIYENMRGIIESADIAILNQETIISESNPVRGADGGALLFNSPPEVADAVIDLGFDVFTMANNHLLDFGTDALTESINFWNKKAEENDLTVLGAYLSEEDANNIRIREVNGVKIAFLAYAEHLNGFSIPDSSPLRVVMNSEEDVIERQIKEAKTKADAVIVAAHWGVEDTDLVSDDRIELAKKMVNWGADVILGCHTHTAETMEWIPRDDGTKGFVYYSMGNFVCAQTDNFNLVGEIPEFDIVLDGETGKTYLDNVSCSPSIVHYDDGNFSNLRIYPYSQYTPELAASHGIPYAVPRGNYPEFSWDIINDIIERNFPAEFRRLDR